MSNRDLIESMTGPREVIGAKSEVDKEIRAAETKMNRSEQQGSKGIDPSSKEVGTREMVGGSWRERR